MNMFPELLTAVGSALLAGILVALFYFGKLKSLLIRIKNARGNSRKKTEPGFVSIFKNLDSEVQGWAKDRDNEVEQMKLLENYRKEFLGNVSHELKTPIFNIQGYLHTLIDGGLEDPAINKDYLNRAAKSVERMISIVEDLQAISLLEAGELELDMEKFDVAFLTKDIFESFEMRAKEKGIALQMKNYSVEPIYVLGDRQRIRQVLTNLISNSIRYGKENGETKVKFSDAGEKIMIEVSDTGLGIPEKHLARIFERFYRVDKSRSREQGGTGLGLAIVKHIIEAHRQTINVMSTEGVGSVFTFSMQKPS